MQSLIAKMTKIRVCSGQHCAGDHQFMHIATFYRDRDKKVECFLQDGVESADSIANEWSIV